MNIHHITLPDGSVFHFSYELVVVNKEMVLCIFNENLDFNVRSEITPDAMTEMMDFISDQIGSEKPDHVMYKDVYFGWAQLVAISDSLGIYLRKLKPLNSVSDGEAIEMGYWLIKEKKANAA